MCGIKISLFSPFRHDGLGDLKRWDMGRHLLFTSWSSCSRSPPCPCPWWEGAWRGYKLKYYYMTIDNLITNSGSQLCRYLPNVVHHLVWYGDFSIWNAKQLVYRHNLTPAQSMQKAALVVFDLSSQSAPNQLGLIGNVLILFPGSISKHASKPSYTSISRLRFNLNNQELQPPPSLHHRISDFGDILCSYDRSYELLLTLSK